MRKEKGGGKEKGGSGAGAGLVLGRVLCMSNSHCRLLTWTNCVYMRIFMVVCRPSWSAHSERPGAQLLGNKC